MGILNVTPDSFYDGGYYYHPEDAEKRVNQMIDEGADIIDIGGMSTRPGSDPVRIDQEIERTVPLIKNIRAASDILISIDTYRKEVAERAAAVGADIINDISALSFDRQMAGFLADSGLSVVLMHMKGTPKDMQENPVYEDVVSEVYAYLDAAAGRAVAAGIERDKIVVDPGIGFGKTAGHNLVILKKLAEFRYLGYPVLLGASRKSFMGKTLELEGGSEDVAQLGSSSTCLP
ncbi:MAG: dihydropteroate synthase [Actinomycetota bacterium]|nr:dihydropteroate synthase [Actinomycetota bacterium]